MTKQHRLNINLNDETANTLRELMAENGTSITETIRRAVFVYKFFEDERANGRKVQTVSKNGRNRQDIIFP